jgi:hypothetical protein
MESTATFRLPVQIAPIYRALPGRQGHQHSGGIEAAICEAYGELGTPYKGSSSRGEPNYLCLRCCREGGTRWVSGINPEYVQW